jgi:hypothetical protein
MVYEKHIVRAETNKIMKYMAFCGRKNRDYAECLQNTVNFPVS